MGFFKRKKIAAVSDKAKTAFVATTGPLLPTHKSPDEAFGTLFSDVQQQRIYPDGKTFVDLVPRKRAVELKKEYDLASKDPAFDLHEFINRHFYEFAPHKERTPYVPNRSISARHHVTHLWSELERRNRVDRGSLIALPHPYIVPGGRFSEQFYWDSYFIMIGLAADKQWQMIFNMLRNYAYMMRKYGLIPTANRTYFLSRSQPPFFSHMLHLMARGRGRRRTFAEFLPTMLGEYRFWMRGRRAVSERADHVAYLRVVQMPNGMILNRYYDNKSTPRPESAREDIETAAQFSAERRERVFVDLRAAAESGWDFSSRWFRDSHAIETVHTTDFVPVDLNCLIYSLERTIAETYTLIGQPLLARRFYADAERRAETIRRFCWNEKERYFYDYDFRKKRTSERLTLAGVYPLFCKIASREQAEAVAEKVAQDFIEDGGLMTTLEDTGQQWDAPNGWAPLQYVAIMGLREYGFFKLAREIRDRWLETVEFVYSDRHKMVEKYDVLNQGVLGGGGEYPLQDGFGWTNGVYAVLKDEQQRERKAVEVQ